MTCRLVLIAFASVALVACESTDTGINTTDSKPDEGELECSEYWTPDRFVEVDGVYFRADAVVVNAIRRHGASNDMPYSVNPDRLSAKIFDENIDCVRSTAATFGLRVGGRYAGSWFTVKVPDSVDVIDALQILRRIPRIECAKPVVKLESFAFLADCC